MWQVTQTHKKFLAMIFVLALACIAILNMPVMQISMAQESIQNNNMRELLESLRVKTETEPGFEISIQFVHPILDNDDVWWTIPYRPQDQDIYRTFGEIANGFVCFNERAGSSNATRCTPFSNIVSINYLAN